MRSLRRQTHALLVLAHGTALLLEHQVQPNAGAQHLLIDRLVDEVHGPVAQRLGLASRVVAGGDVDDRDAAPGRRVADRRMHLVAAHAGHHHIQQHDVGQRPGLERLQRLGAGDGRDAVVLVAQHADEHVQVDLDVIDDQDT